MSQQLSTIQTIEFDAQVKAAYQKAGLLRPYVRLKTGFTGATVKFRRYKRGVATPRVPQSNVTVMGQGYNEATATMADWNAADYTDVFDQAKTNIEERPIIAANVAAAIGRREDQMIIGALDAANAGFAIADGGTGLTAAKVRRLNALFDDIPVPRNERYAVISPRGKEDLLAETIFINNQYMPTGAVTNGELPHNLFGIHFIVMEKRDEGGLPLAGNIRTCFAWDKMALGLAIGMEKRVAVDWIPEKTSWLVNQMFSGGAVAVDPAGIIEFACVEA